MNKYFTFYTVTEQSDLSENMTSWYANKRDAQKYCNKLNKETKEEYSHDGLWTDDLLIEVETVEIPKGKKSLLNWLNNYYTS